MADLFVTDTNSASRHEIKRYGYTLEFFISADAVECYCSYVPTTTGGAPLSDAELQGFFRQFKVSEGIIPEATAFLLNAAATATSLEGHLLAQGVVMTPGDNGYIELVASDDLGKGHPDDDDADVVDLRHVQSFLNVDEGNLVAKIIPPGTGTPGKTVSGKIVPPEPGEPVKLELGQNVRLGDDGLSIFATATGRVYCRNNEISVEDLYVVKGDVGFKVGNISFKGFVEITGDIQDGFSVKATKGIKVHGVIGACAIESDGDISFSGMNGQGKGTIVCGGSLTANFIYETSIECCGDITAETEIRNAEVRCLGALRVNKNGVAGGEYFALAGLETAVLGNISHLRTRVVVGVHYRDLEELNTLFNELKVLIAQYTSAPRGSTDPKEFAEKRAEITARTQAVRSRTYEQANSKVNVKKIIYEGVTITLGTLTETIVEERKGPLSLIENTIEGGFRFLGMTPLSFNAQEIEQTFMKQYQLEQNKAKI